MFRYGDLGHRSDYSEADGWVLSVSEWQGSGELTECTAAASEFCITMAVVPESIMADLADIRTELDPTVMFASATSQYLASIGM